MPKVRDPVRERSVRLHSSPAHHPLGEGDGRAVRGKKALRFVPELDARMFRCIRCGEPLPSDSNLFGVRCDNCGGKIFTKEHPNVKKTLKAR